MFICIHVCRAHILQKILYNEKINNEKLSGREKMIIFKV